MKIYVQLVLGRIRQVAGRGCCRLGAHAMPTESEPWIFFPRGYCPTCGWPVMVWEGDVIPREDRTPWKSV